jgi:ribose transport system ATP-binding protein
MDVPDPVALLEMQAISKSFAGVPALADVNFDVRRGEVHVLLGENGAGKSTLMNIIAGVYPCDSGSIRWRGQPVRFTTPAEAQHAGIAIIYQESSLVPHLSVAENIFLGFEPPRVPGLPFINWDKVYLQTGELLARLNLDIDPYASASTLSVAERKLVEVAKALRQSVDLVIMDEPTATLAAREVADLFSAIRALRAQGVAIVYVSHRLEEVMQIGDRATVLRDGRKIGTLALTEASLDDLVHMIVGHYLPDKFPHKTTQLGPEVLRVEGLTSAGSIDHVSFTLHAGEILGVTGLIGAGGTAIVRAVFGADPIEAGSIYLDNQLIKIDSPQDAIAHGIGLLTEDRHEQGLVPLMSTQDNMTLAALGKAWPGPFIDRDTESEIVNHYAERLGIRDESLAQDVLYLSGGTQQKVVISKWLATRSRVLIFDEPTQGIDVGARVAIYHFMNELAQEGSAIIVVSSDLSEILGLCDRILVLYQGRVAANLPRAAASRQIILAYANGEAPA